jgi:hypothetical protein
MALMVLGIRVEMPRTLRLVMMKMTTRLRTWTMP